MTTLALPTIHLNGSSRSKLLDQTVLACDSLRLAIENLVDASPNARDYYTQGDGAFKLAVAQHTDREMRLRSVLAELSAIAEHIDSA